MFVELAPSTVIGVVLLEAGSGLLFFFFSFYDNIDGDVDGDGRGGDDDSIFVTRRRLKLSCNRLYWEKGDQSCTHDSCSVEGKGIIRMLL